MGPGKGGDSSGGCVAAGDTRWGASGDTRRPGAGKERGWRRWRGEWEKDGTHEHKRGEGNSLDQTMQAEEL